MSSLSHHGIKGQKWGVRRFQNKDGTLTAAGRKRQTESLRSSQEANNVKSKIHSYINKQLSSEDLDTGKSNFDFASDLIKDPDFEKVIMPVVQDIRQTKAKYGNKEPYELTGNEQQAYMNDISRIDNKAGELAITIGLAEKGEPNKKSTPSEGEYERVDMFRYALARYLDEHSPGGYSDEGDWIYHSSIGGTMYIEGNALILGDSSYLEHHGIRGQRWGVRRFQNRDGSLTNAGRKRLGYATKGAIQTVGKAFKAGVKVGGNAVKAAKAHHEAAEAKKKEKKKEKASKTRLGVMANKDLFTNEEIRKLNERFKLEDEMKMATLQKGVEIAKAVGTIAQNVGTMAKAYEDVTGQSLSPIKRKAAEEKAKQDAEDRKRKLAKEDAETKRAEDKEKRDIEDRERRIKLEDEDRVRKQAKEDADAQRAENAEKRAQAKEQRDSSMAVELQRKAKAAADEQEHKAVKAKAESRSAILDVLEKIDKIQDHDDDDHNNPPGGGIDTWDDDDYLNFFKKTGIIHSDVSDGSLIQNGVLFVDSSDGLTHHGVKGQRWGVRRFQNEDGSLTEKGRKHYEKAIAKIDRMQTHSDARRGRLERQHPFAVTGSAIAGAIAAGLSIAATGGASVAVIAAGSAISAAVSAGITHASYSVNEAWEGRGTRHRQKKRKEYEEMLNHDGLIVNDGTLYLAHHGIRGQRWGVRRFQNADGTRTALGKKREMYGATVSVHGHKSSESVGVTKKQAKGKAAAEILKNSKDLSEKERKSLQKHVDRAEKETAKLEKYKEKKKREQERNAEESKVRAWQALGSGVISPDKYKQNIDAINKNHKREIEYLNKMDERDMANEKAFTRKTVAKGVAYATAATAGLAGITAATTGWMVISGYAAVGGGMVGAISGEMKRAQYREERRKEMGIDAKHDALSIQNGTLFINAGEPYLEHHGVKGMKWGKHLMAGKSEAGAGGGAGEDDEKLKEMAKKAGMSVAEYRTKMAGKLGGAAKEKKRLLTQTSAEAKRISVKDKEKKRLLTQTSAEAKKVSVKDKHLVINRSGSSTNAGTRSGYQILPEDSSGAARPKAERKKITRKDVGEALYNIAGGNAKKAAQEHHRNMVNYKNEADKYSRDANIEGSAAKAHKRAGNVSAYVGAKTGARVDEENAKNYRLAQYSEAEEANKAQRKYDRSLAGLYDKATGKYKQVHKQTKTPSLSKQYQYYMKDVNGKLFDHGNPKTAKERAKAEVWNAADYRIKAQDYYNQSFDPTNTAYGYDTAYRKAAVDQGRLAEGAYRRAAALGKQASSETSTSSRPRARKKKYTSGGSGVTVRRPGRKPVSRTKRVTQSSTGVKRRGSTGSGRTVRRGA